MAAICRSTIIKEGTPFTSEWSLRSLRNSHAVYVGIYIPFISEWLRRSAGICTHNIILLGATGAGKTYIACALGIAANRNLYTVRYIRLPDLLVEIAMARGDGTYREYMKKLKKVKLLILDEWLLYPLKESEARDVLELVEARSKTASTIFCSQYDTSEWHENLYDSNLADAICDRIIYDAYTIQIEGESMRKRKGIIE